MFLYYIHRQRSKVKKDRKAWRELVDKRMSTISPDWKCMSTAGANDAIHNSMNSAALSNIDQSTSAAEGDLVPRNVGKHKYTAERGLQNHSLVATPTVSFANDQRPSSESTYTRDVHNSYGHPVPLLSSATSREISADNDEEEDYGDSNSEETGSAYSNNGCTSPDQTQYPLMLTPEFIKTRIAAGRARAAACAK